MRRAKIASLVAITAALVAAPASAAGIASLRYIGEQVIATGTQFAGTTIGGLSGIDYIGGGNYVAISDDRSQLNPARFYTLDLDLTEAAFTGVNFRAVTTLRDTAGNPYAALSIDPEAIRRLSNGNYLYTSEGDVNAGINAFVREARADGSFVRDVTLPAGVQQTGAAGTTGIRQNLAFESLTLANGGSTFVTATENALRQDGPGASFGVGSASRILTFDAASGSGGAQFVYDVAPVASPTTPPGGFSTNGLVELLSLGGTQYLAIERSFVQGLVTPTSATGNSIQLYVIDTAGATDVQGLASLSGQSFTPVSKSLLLDLDTLGIPLDNIEGVSFGALLPNGKQSLILVSDNNFSGAQFTQFLAFEVTAVPEPSSWALMIAGFGLVGGSLRRRRAIAAWGRLHFG